jgi:hypothetical protein
MIHILISITNIRRTAKNKCQTVTHTHNQRQNQSSLVSIHNRNTQHDRKTNPSLWDIQVHGWDHILKLQKQKHSNFHQQHF